MESWLPIIAGIIGSLLTVIGTHVLPKLVQYYKDKRASKLAQEKQNADIQSTKDKEAFEILKDLVKSYKEEISQLNEHHRKEDSELIQLKSEHLRCTEKTEQLEERVLNLESELRTLKAK